MRRPPRLSVALCATVSVALVVAGCVGSAVPQLPVSVAAAISATPMRRLESADIILYYPAARRDEATRFLSRVGACVSALRLRALGGGRLAHQKVVLLFPELPYNNAFVESPMDGYEELGVVPTLFTSDEFSLENGIPPDPATIACHEVTHFVHLQQIEGVALSWNAIFGQAYTPQAGFDSWFLEGLAVYYETLLLPGTGRLASPFWQGLFAAGVAGRRLGGGDLSAFDRDFDSGNNYLVGSRFVKFLADRYGEDKLWRLIDLQARSVLFPFAINVQFSRAFGKGLSKLIDEFADDVRARTPVVARPSGQHALRDAGSSARYARARDGTEALVVADHDQPTRLRVFAPDGRLLVEEELTDVLPPRTLATSGPRVSGGLSFTPDGKTLYFVTVDQDSTYPAARLVRYDIPGRFFEVVVPDLGGPGGSLSADGRRYLFPHADGDHHDLAEVDLATGEVRVLAAQAPGRYVAQPRVSPDGTRVVVTTFDGQRFGLALHDAKTGRRLRVLPTGPLFVNDASWADDERIVFLGSPRGDVGFQVHLLDLRDDSTTQLSHAPYLAFAPQASGGTVRFLNREGLSWTVDEIALPALPARRAPAAPPAPEIVFLAAEPSLDVADANLGPLAPFPQRPDPPTTITAAPPPPAPSAVPSVAPPLPPPTILSDGPASASDHLLVPSLRSPLLGTTSAGDLILGASLTGTDRLERHRWVLTGLYEPVVRTPSFRFAYSNRQLAPVTLTLSASQVTEREEFFFGFPSTPDHFFATLRDRLASLQATRTFYGNPVSAGGSFVDHLYNSVPGLTTPVGPVEPKSSRIGLAGGFVSARYAGSQSTPYTGTRRLFLASATLADYPGPWGTFATNLLDARGEVALTTPLPFLPRQTLTFVFIGRALELGADTFPFPYLTVGGLPSSLLWRDPEPPTRIPTAPELPSTLVFRESLRGFEDRTIATERVAIAEASYLYPFIIDRGWASTFVLLPSFFVRQLDLNLFANAAFGARRLGSFDTGTSYHEAEGAALILSTVFGSTPLTLTYQISRRRTDDRGVTQLVALTN